MSTDQEALAKALQHLDAWVRQKSGASLVRVEQSYPPTLDAMFRLPKDRTGWHQLAYLLLEQIESSPPATWRVRVSAEYRLKEGKLVQAGVLSLMPLTSGPLASMVDELVDLIRRLEKVARPQMTRAPVAAPMNGFEIDSRGRGAMPTLEANPLGYMQQSLSGVVGPR